jgi:type II restriction/modification system DNA methylase subunit YeeA
MEKGGEFDLTKIAHFNGGLFDGRRALRLESGDIGLLVAAASLDWSQIDPTIFGTLFERFLDPQKRGQIGAHYTDPDKIMMIVDPVIVRPLKAEWVEARTEIEELLHGTRVRPMRAKTRRRMTPQEAAEEVRSRYLERLRNLTILDPACGSGNFLYLALQAVKDLELKANLECEALNLPSRTPAVGPEIVRGIEINPLAAELARTTIWIGDIQWGIRNAIYARPEPILRPLDAIECRDALISVAPDGSVTESEWPKSEFIVGIPPFLGSQVMRSGLGDEYVESIGRIYNNRVPGGADLVTYWFEKARAAVEKTPKVRVGLIATQSIRRGASRIALDRIHQTTQIFEAWSDEDWTIEGADVRVSLVCFGNGTSQKHLDGKLVSAIHSDLSGSAYDLTSAVRLNTNLNVCFQGPVKVGAFEIPGDLARSWLTAPRNPNGRANSEVLVPWANASDIVRRPRGKWIIDFGEMNEREASLFELPFEYVRENIKPFHIANRDRQRRDNWWRLGRSGGDLKNALRSLQRFIITPRVSRYRIFVYAQVPMLPDTRLVAIARDDDVTFGVVHSRFHESWSTRLGGWHGVGNDPQYTPSLGFETFPFPQGLTPDILAVEYAKDPRAEAIATAAKRLDHLRNNWLNPPDLVRIEPEVVSGYPDRLPPKDTGAAAKLRERTLTKLYNERPQWLVDAHRDLDAAVAAAYGWPADISEEEALARLLELNLARAGVSQPIPAGFAEEAPEPEQGATLGREQFAKISEVEGVRLTDAGKEALTEFDRKGLPAEERRRAIIGRFKPSGK